MAGKDNVAPDKDNDNLLNHNTSNIASNWQIRPSNLTSSSMGRISSSDPMTVCRGNVLESLSCSPTMWDQLPGVQNSGFSDVDVSHGASISNALGKRPIGREPSRPGLDCTPGMGWNPPNTMPKGGMFIQGAGGFFPPSLAQISADSSFIERAARYSCFSGGNSGDIMNPFSISESGNPHSRSPVTMQGSLEDFIGRGLTLTSRMPCHKNEMKTVGSSKDVVLPVEFGPSEESLHKNQKASKGMGRSIDEAKLGASDSSHDSGEADYGGRGGQEELEGVVGDDSSEGIDSNKRKRCGQEPESDRGPGISKKRPEDMKEHMEIEQKEKQNPISTTGKPSRTNAKQGPGASDSHKIEYIHVRARRGQATNSHSLAERVRRERISERMKFLQDLVPGCSKVTGKAVMLDEIINYVQSLQRQVEFLSMKLATVNPRLDSNLEMLLAKDILPSRGVPFSSPAFPPTMPMGYPPLHQSQGIVQAGIQTIGNSTDALRRSMNFPLAATGGGYKEHSSHVSSVWENELHNVVHMKLNSTAPPSSQ